MKTWMTHQFRCTPSHVARRGLLALTQAAVLALMLAGPGSFGTPARAALTQDAPAWPTAGSEGYREDAALYLGTVQWGTGRAVSQGVAFVNAGVAPESPAYWRAAARARGQAIARLRSLLNHAAAARRAVLDPDALYRSLSRALVDDRDFDPASGQVTLTISAGLYGRLGALTNSHVYRDISYNPYSRDTLTAVDGNSLGIVTASSQSSTQAPIEAISPPMVVAPPITTPQPVAEPQPAGVPLSATPAGQQGPFTGVVIDCRGLGLLASPSPRLLRQDGHIVWGDHVKADHDFVEAVGIAGFLEDWDRAVGYQKRVGDHPLLIRAVGVSGGASRAYAVLSDDDAAWLQREDAQTHFLDGFHVMFVVDPLAQ